MNEQQAAQALAAIYFGAVGVVAIVVILRLGLGALRALENLAIRFREWRRRRARRLR